MHADIAKRSVRTITESDLDRDAKLEALRQLERDLQSRSVASEEGMAGVAPMDDIGAVRAARRELRDPELGAATPPTKYS